MQRIIVLFGLLIFISGCALPSAKQGLQYSSSEDDALIVISSDSEEAVTLMFHSVDFENLEFGGKVIEAGLCDACHKPFDVFLLKANDVDAEFKVMRIPAENFALFRKHVPATKLYTPDIYSCYAKGTIIYEFEKGKVNLINYGKTGFLNEDRMAKHMKDLDKILAQHPNISAESVIAKNLAVVTFEADQTESTFSFCTNRKGIKIKSGPIIEAHLRRDL